MKRSLYKPLWARSHGWGGHHSGGDRQPVPLRIQVDTEFTPPLLLRQAVLQRVEHGLQLQPQQQHHAEPH